MRDVKNCKILPTLITSHSGHFFLGTNFKPATGRTQTLWDLLYRPMTSVRSVLKTLAIATIFISCAQTSNKKKVKIDIEQILKIEDATTAITQLDSTLNAISNHGQEIERLTESQKTVLIVENLEREINNGGFNQFFFNSSGQFAQETVTALRSIKAFETADIVSKSISVWPNQEVPKDWTKRQEILEAISEQADVVWNECDEEFYKYQDNIVTLLLEYVKSNKSDF